MDMITCITGLAILIDSTSAYGNSPPASLTTSPTVAELSSSYKPGDATAPVI